MKRTRIVALILLLVGGIALIVFWLRPIAADILPNEQITVDGAARNYRLVIPHTHRKPAPVVFAFHGIGDSPEGMARYSHLDELAAQHGFLLVYPTARNSMWAPEQPDADKLDANPDVLFFDQLLRQLADRYEIDRSRVYAVGMSNGGSFVQLLAIARPDDIAAIAAHSGSKPREIGSSLNPYPVLLIVGANDLAARPMEADAERYRLEGHVVEFVSIPDLEHAWSPGHNAEIWSFLSRCSLDRNN